MTYIIERGITIPPKQNSGFTGHGKWKQLADKMQVGDSVELRSQKEARSLYAALKNTGKKSSQRKIDNNIRLWRIE